MPPKISKKNIENASIPNAFNEHSAQSASSAHSPCRYLNVTGPGRSPGWFVAAPCYLLTLARPLVQCWTMPSYTARVSFFW
jgi:hypothetical protein